MAETDDEGDEPAVELGTDEPVPGAPLSRVAARQTWPKEKSEIVDRDGSIEVRSADGPIPLGDLLEDVDDTYFASRRHFVEAVRDRLPDGPVGSGD